MTDAGVNKMKAVQRFVFQFIQLSVNSKASLPIPSVLVSVASFTTNMQNWRSKKKEKQNLINRVNNFSIELMACNMGVTKQFGSSSSLFFLALCFCCSIGTIIPKGKCENLYDEQDDTQEMETTIETAGVTGELQNKDAEGEVDDKKPESMCEQDKADLGMHASDSSGYHSDRGQSKKKKRKLYDEDSGLPGSLQPKAKKKRKE